ncbi:lipocalin family protein [Glaciimonas sp. PCH181]|uniref:lipocalin family protein n=1 Tax=Glaciimonas sp. PCH181 TaxID=2133943 RepID=UPI000D339DFC|nr:lipocalin family protein [Glaciimonas sp. PCH181]PUA17903.1 lipocalin [Glaciimonas sp. PCH181]
MKKYFGLLALLMAIPPSTMLAQNAAGVGTIIASPVTAVSSVDLARYVGKWYEIARFPNSFQKKCSGNVTAEYSTRTDGNIDVLNRCQKSDGAVVKAAGVARVVDTASNAKLKVRFAPAWLAWLPMVWGDYWVLELASDYSYAVVGEPGRNYLWVLSRSPSLPDAVYQSALTKVAAQGFDVSKLVKTKQD